MRSIILAMSFSFATIGFAQTSIPDDTSSVDKVIRATYEIISGPAGKRNWDRFKNLFDKEASMGVIYESKTDGKILYKTFTPEDYIAKNDPYFLKNGFVEVETGRSENIMEDIAQVFSNYEFTSNGISQKGVNTFLLYRDENRWYISSLIWKEQPTVK
jgi:hypothetical protein